MRRKRWMRVLGLMAGLALVGAACGGDDDDPVSGTTTGDGGGELEAAPGFDGTTIRLGVLTPTEGAVSVIGNPLTAGNQAYFDMINGEGGVDGQFPVELVIRNTNFQEALASQEYAAIKDDVVMFTQILGTQINTSLVGQLETDGIVGAPASLDSLWVREQNLLPIGAPYQIQSINGLNYWVTDGGGSTDQTLCVLHSDDAFGDAGVEGVTFAAEDLGWEIAETVSFPIAQANPNFTTQIGQLAGASCEVVWLVATPGDAAGIWGTAAAGGFNPQWIANSPAWLSAPYLPAERAGLRAYVEARVLIVAEGGAYGDESIPGMAELVAAQEASGQQPDIYFNFGYLQAQAVHQVLEAAVAAGDLSREGIIAAMNSIDALTFNGLLGDYEWGPPEDRNPPRINSIFKPDLAAPTGLTLVQGDVAAEAAEAFEFEE